MSESKLDRSTWATPKVVYDKMDSFFSFSMDICASGKNHKHERYLTEGDDSLTHDFSKENLKGKWVWCNPPYNKPKPWVQLAIDNATLGIGTVMLVKHDCSTSWYVLAKDNCQAIVEVVGGRIGFIPPDGVKASSNNFPSCFFVFSPFSLGEHQHLYLSKEELYCE